LAQGIHNIGAGLNRLLFRDRATTPGTLQYDLYFAADDDDPIPENNRARLLCGVRGPRPLLHIAPGKTSGLAKLLRQGKLQVKLKTAGQSDLSLATLSSFAGILLENVPASALGTSGLELVAAWISHAGGGLMLTGGKNMYGPGGYFKSALDPLLPVSMELRREHRKLKLAIVVALDRSGSMSMSAGGGRTKMDLANLGTVQVLDLLSDSDELGVIAVDSSPHNIVDIDRVSRVRSQRGRILSIGSQGGGIFVYEALVAASRMLLRAEAGTRHIILFADAADSEEPGQYVELLEKCRKANITVSVVGLGKVTDVDASLLEDIAKRGEGRCFFSDDPHQIPQLFAQDTFAVARSTFIQDETAVKLLPGLISVTGAMLPDPPAVGGYNLCYLKPGATLGGVTQDEYKAPLVASWQAGNGRVVSFAGEADGEFAGPFAGWGKIGEFYTGLARWTAGIQDELPGGMVITQDLSEGLCRVQLHLDPERTEEPFQRPPQVSFLRGIPGTKPEARRLTMHWETADILTAKCFISGAQTVLSTVFLPAGKRRILPPVCLPYSPEFRPPDVWKGRRTLTKIAATTGGTECLSLAEMWDRLPRRGRRMAVGPWLFSAALLCFLLGVFQRRTGLLARTARKTPEEQPAKGRRKPPAGVLQKATGRRRRPQAAANNVDVDKSAADQADKQVEETAAPPAEAEPGSTLTAMQKARQRARRRTGR